MKYVGGIIASVLVGVACYFAITYCAQTLFDTRSYTLHFDTVLAENYKKEIAHVIASCFKSSLNAEFVKQLLHNFPCVRAINVHQKRPGLAGVYIAAQKPWLKINNEFVLTAQGILVNRYCYNDLSTKSLVSLTAEPATLELPQEVDVLYTTIKKIDGHILHDFTVHWAHRFLIQFTDKKDPWFALRCEHHAMPNQKMVEQGNHIKKYLQSTVHNAAKDHKRSFIADMRFANQIVI